jgi:hypothetical protein
MTINTFVRFAKSAPQPVQNTIHGYTCHMAALHWAFRELGDTEAIAGARMEAIAETKCQACLVGAPVHLSIPHDWYGTNLCGNAVALADRDAMRANAVKGDVLLVGTAAVPAHSMVVVGKRSLLGGHWTYIRGFNNTGSLGKGGKLMYDNHDRDIDKAALWHAQVGQPTRFGLAYSAGGALSRVSYANFIADATTVRGNFNFAAGAWTYTGP